MKIRALICAAVLASCSDLPKDPEGTLQRVRTERQFRVGEADGSAVPLYHFVERIERATGAEALPLAGSTEPLLEQLEQGKVDLVIGEFASTSPWSKRVTFLPAVAEQVAGDRHVLQTAAVRNGENDWIDLLHREALAVRAGR